MYTLTVGSMRLAPRHDIIVQEPDMDWETVTTSQRECSNCPDLNREFKFILWIGHCDLARACAIKAELDAALCADGAVLTRKVRSELRYKIIGGHTRVIGTRWQYQGTLQLELIVKVAAYAQMESLALSISIPEPTLVMDNNVAQTPMTMSISIPSPDVVLV